VHGVAQFQTLAKYMTLADVPPSLLAEGCNPMTFAVGSRGTASDAFVLVQQNGQWEVFYTERGRDSAPIDIGESEDEVFVDLVCENHRTHLAGQSSDS